MQIGFPISIDNNQNKANESNIHSAYLITVFESFKFTGKLIAYYSKSRAVESENSDINESDCEISRA